nr:Uma2 family endonuclease [Streptomyces milbemycinicus]
MWRRPPTVASGATAENDRGPKLRGYARAGIPCYLLIDRERGHVVVHTEPSGQRYARRTEVDWQDGCPAVSLRIRAGYGRVLIRVGRVPRGARVRRWAAFGFGGWRVSSRASAQNGWQRGGRRRPGASSPAGGLVGGRGCGACGAEVGGPVEGPPSTPYKKSLDGEQAFFCEGAGQGRSHPFEGVVNRW